MGFCSRGEIGLNLAYSTGNWELTAKEQGQGIEHSLRGWGVPGGLVVKPQRGSNAGDLGSVPGGVTKIPHAKWHSQKGGKKRKIPKRQPQG